MADWLAYGLEESLSDTPEIGVVRKIRPTSGLVRYEPRNETLEWSQAVKEILATEKPSAIVVMLGLNDRLPLRDQRAAATGAAVRSRRRRPSGRKLNAQQRTAAPPDAAKPDGEQPPIAASEPRIKRRRAVTNFTPTNGRSSMPSASTT